MDGETQALWDLEASTTVLFEAYLEDEESELSTEEAIEAIVEQVIDEELDAEKAMQIVRGVLKEHLWELNKERHEGYFFESLSRR
jgi:DNA repair photolyase